MNGFTILPKDGVQQQTNNLDRKSARLRACGYHVPVSYLTAMALAILVRNIKSLDKLVHFRFTRSMSNKTFLIEQPRYGFLKELGLEANNLGVYNGKWFANGKVKWIMQFTIYAISFHF